MAEPRPQCRSASRWLSLGTAAAALGLAAVTARHLLAPSSAWLTPFNLAVSLGLVALALASLIAIALDRRWLRIAIPIALLGANVGFIVAHLAGHRLVSFAAYPSPMFAVLLATATTLGAIGLVRRLPGSEAARQRAEGAIRARRSARP